LAAAREVAQRFASWRPAIKALFEHYEPYSEAVTAGELPLHSEVLPRIAAPGDVWSHVSLVFVSVTTLSGLLTTELGYTTATTSTRWELGFSQENLSSSVAVFCFREDGGLELAVLSARAHAGENQTRRLLVLAFPTILP
jgi:hypothetical protein